MPTERRDYLPALRFRALTRVYDPVIRLATREDHFKRLLIEQAAPSAGQRVLDIGCGTGTLAIEVKRTEPGAEVVGLDADPEMLEQARSKAAGAGVEIGFDEGYSTELPYPDGSFDLVLSTLFFHHLDPEPKRLTAGEIARVVRPGGELHVGDVGRPSDPAMAAAVLPLRVFDGFSNTRDNVHGTLPEIFERAGLEDAEETRRLRTMIGTLALYRARRGAGA
jgi:ubiquinone/menaquinone biosynthesis C-methylase UbiE